MCLSHRSLIRIWDKKKNGSFFLYCLFFLSKTVKISLSLYIYILFIYTFTKNSPLHVNKLPLHLFFLHRKPFESSPFTCTSRNPMVILPFQCLQLTKSILHIANTYSLSFCIIFPPERERMKRWHRELEKMTDSVHSGSITLPFDLYGRFPSMGKQRIWPALTCWRLKNICQRCKLIYLLFFHGFNKLAPTDSWNGRRWWYRILGWCMSEWEEILKRSSFLGEKLSGPFAVSGIISSVHGTFSANIGIWFLTDFWKYSDFQE